MDKDLLGYLMATFPDESEPLRRPDMRDYLTIRGYRVSYEAGADPDILDLLSELQPGTQRGWAGFAQGSISTRV